MPLASAAVKTEESNLPAWVRHGVDLCRQGKWQEGLPVLIRAAESSNDPEHTKLPARFYSYLGYGLADAITSTRAGE